MKRTLKIVGKVMLSLMVAAYVTVALCNYSVVQSYLGAAASNYFSRQWGGTLRIGSIHVTPLGHVKLRDILLVSPTDDTIFDGRSIHVRFSHFPLQDDGLELSRVHISDAYYHLGFDSTGINMKYIFNYFASNETDTTEREGPFIVRVHRLMLDDIHYKQDLKNQSEYYGRYGHGVNVSHMDLTHICGNFKDVVVQGGPDVNCRIVRLSADECSGFRMLQLSGDVSVTQQNITVHNMILKTDHTDMNCEVDMHFNGFESFGEFFDSVMFDVVMHEGTRIGLKDAGYWAPSLWGVEDTVGLVCAIHGPMGHFRIDSMELSLSQNTRLHLNGYVNGLPHVATTVFDLDIHPSQVSSREVAAMRQPELRPLFTLPPIVQRLGHVSLYGRTQGSLREGTVDLKARSDVGDLDVQATTAYSDHPRDLRYTASITSHNLQVAHLLGDDRVSSSDLRLDIQGKGTFIDDLAAHIELELSNSVVQQHHFAPLQLRVDIDHREIRAEGHIDDTLIALDFDGKGKLQGNDSYYQMHADIGRCKIAELLGRGDSKPSGGLSFATTADIDMRGTDINRMQGNVSLQSTTLSIGDRKAHIDSLLLSLREDHYFKTLTINSEIAQIELNGYFDYTRLPRVWNLFAKRYLPHDMLDGDEPLEDSTAVTTAFYFSARWNDPQRQLSAFLQRLHVAPGTHLHGSCNYSETIKLVGQSDSIRYGAITLRDVVLTGNPVGESYGATCRAEKVSLGDGPMMEGMDLFVSSNPSQGRLRISWDDDENTLRDEGNIALLVLHDGQQHTVRMTDHTFYLRGQRWDFVCDDITTGPNTVQVPRLELHSGNSALKGEAHILPSGSRNASIRFEHFNIDVIDSLLLADKHLMLEGIVEGYVEAGRTSEDVASVIVADLYIDNCSANQQSLGRVDIHSGIDIVKQRIALLATSTLQTDSSEQRPLTAHGFITLEKKPQVDLSAHFDNFSIATVAPLLSSFASRVDGSLSSDIKITGPLSHPQLEGVVHVHGGLLQVDYTGVTYLVDDSVRFAHRHILVDSLHVRDVDNHILTVSGGVDYTDANRTLINLTVKSDGIQVFNTNDQSKTLYGTLVTALDGTITGTTDNLTISAKAHTRKGSEITIPVDYKLSSSEQDYIHFVVPQRQLTTMSNTASESPATMPTISLTLSITPELTLHVPMDYNQLTADITAVGDGNLQLYTGAGQKTSVVGNYEFTSGTFGLTILSLLDKNFTIDPGSSILFPGDINNMRFDISAVYSLRANLNSLTGAESENAMRNITVDDIINLRGSIQEPVITFDIRLPNVDATTSEEVFTYIDRNDQRDMLNQSISLLLMGQFYSSTNESQVRSSSTTSGYGVMAKSVGNIVSQLVKVVDIEVGYTAATDLTTEQFDIDISKSWDRLYFETSLGYGGESRTLSNDADTRAASNLVGDVLVGYRINPRLHFFVFNRSNTNDYTRMELPYKQGMGMKFTRDFNRWGDLFRKTSSQR